MAVMGKIVLFTILMFATATVIAQEDQSLFVVGKQQYKKRQ
jgi:hypothetical protein